MTAPKNSGRPQGSWLGVLRVMAWHGGPDGDVVDIGLLRTLLDLDLERNRRS